MKTITLIVILSGLGVSVEADIQRLFAEANTVAFDSFEAYDDNLTRLDNGQNPSYTTLEVLGGAASYSATDLAGQADVGQIYQPDKGIDHSLGSFGVSSPRTGSQFLAVFAAGPRTVHLEFADPVWGFGGYYQFRDSGPLWTRFFDSSGVEIQAADTVAYTERTSGNRFFLGWYSSGNPIKTIRFSAADIATEHSVDDIMIFDSVPEPGTLAALGLGAAALLRRRKR